MDREKFIVVADLSIKAIIMMLLLAIVIELKLPSLKAALASRSDS